MTRTIALSTLALLACSAPPDAPDEGTSESSPVICTVESTGSCTGGPTHPKPLPDVTYAIATATPTSATISFYTPKGPQVATVQVGRRFPPPLVGDDTPAVAEQSAVDSSAVVPHSLGVGNLDACAEYWFAISYGGVVRYVGTLFTTNALASASADEHAVTYATTAASPVMVAITDKLTGVQTLIPQRPGDASYGRAAVNAPGRWFHWRVAAGSCVIESDAELDAWADASQYRPIAGTAPSGYDYPSDSAMGWTHEVQGAAHDATHWYLAEKGATFQVDVTHDLNDHDATYPSFVPTAGHDHMGDPDVLAGRWLLSPLEGGTPTIAVYDTATMTFVRELALSLPPGGSPASDELAHAPWVAVSPADGRLYTSTFDGVHALRSYHVRTDASGAPIALDDPRWFELGATIARVQGGEFSPNGHFYLTSDDADSPALYGFDVRQAPDGSRPRATPPLRLVMGLDRGSPSGPLGIGTGQEIEGLTIWDVDGRGAPNVTGQIHVMMNEHDSAVFFKHFEIADAAYVDKL